MALGKWHRKKMAVNEKRSNFIEDELIGNCVGLLILVETH
jgi:hypothetical protein